MMMTLFTAVTVNAQAPIATPQEAIAGLLDRIGGKGASDKFVTVVDSSLTGANGEDAFVITSQDGKPCIKGNSVLSVATGINWYLNHYAHINLTWNNLTTDLTTVSLPVPAAEEKRTSSAAYRFASSVFPKYLAAHAIIRKSFTKNALVTGPLCRIR